MEGSYYPTTTRQLSPNERSKLYVQDNAEHFVELQKQSVAVSQAIGLANTYSRSGFFDKLTQAGVILNRFTDKTNIKTVNDSLKQAGIVGEFTPYSGLFPQSKASSEQSITFSSHQYAINSLLDLYSTSIKKGDYSTARMAVNQLNSLKLAMISGINSTKTNRDLQYLFLSIGDKAASGIVNLQYNNSLRNILLNKDKVKDSFFIGANHAIDSFVASGLTLLTQALHMSNLAKTGGTFIQGHVSPKDIVDAKYGELSDYSLSVSNALQVGAMFTAAYMATPTAAMQSVLPSFISRSPMAVGFAKAVASGVELKAVEYLQNNISHLVQSNVQGTTKGKEQVGDFFGSLVVLGATAAYHKYINTNKLKYDTPDKDAVVVEANLYKNENIEIKPSRKAILTRCLNDIVETVPNDEFYSKAGEVLNFDVEKYNGIKNINDTMLEAVVHRGVDLLPYDETGRSVSDAVSTKLSPEVREARKLKNKVRIGEAVRDVVTGNIPDALVLKENALLDDVHINLDASYKIIKKYFSYLYDNAADVGDKYYNVYKGSHILNNHMNATIESLKSLLDDVIGTVTEFNSDKAALIEEIKRLTTRLEKSVSDHSSVSARGFLQDQRHLWKAYKRLLKEQGKGSDIALNSKFDALIEQYDTLSLVLFGQEYYGLKRIGDFKYKAVMKDSGIQPFINGISLNTSASFLPANPKAALAQIGKYPYALSYFSEAIKTHIPDAYNVVSPFIEEASQQTVSFVFNKYLQGAQGAARMTSLINKAGTDDLLASHLVLMHGKEYAKYTIGQIIQYLILTDNVYKNLYNPSNTADKVFSKITNAIVVKDVIDIIKTVFPDRFEDLVELVKEAVNDDDVTKQKQINTHLIRIDSENSANSENKGK